MKRKSRKKKRIFNIFFNINAFISIIIMIVFFIFLYRLDMIPMKYLSIIYIIIGIVFFILLLLTVPKKIKLKIKSICFILFLLFNFLFCFGIKYIDKTIDFIDVINDDLAQKEDYHLSVLLDSSFNNLDDIKDSEVGIYSSNNETYDKLVSLLQKEKIEKIKKYTDVISLFEDLSDKKLGAIMVNNSLENLLSTDLEYMKLELKSLHTLMVPIYEEEVVKVVDVINTPFNIYIAGGDAYGSINKVTNTDVNMVVSVDPLNHKILLTSIPRDYYVVLPSKGETSYDKLTHAGYYGIGESVKAVENLLDIEINYYAKVNFSTIEGVIDAIGGINVYVDEGFTTSNGVYTFKKGNNYMDGAKALRFARERKVFASGDVQRVKNQQKVFSAIIKKMTSSTSLITGYANILDSVKNNFSTNLDTKSINRLVKMQLSDMRGWNIESQNLVGKNSMEKTFTFPKMNLYVMKQDEESVNKASEKITEFIKK